MVVFIQLGLQCQLSNALLQGVGHVCLMAELCHFLSDLQVFGSPVADDFLYEDELLLRK